MTFNSAERKKKRYQDSQKKAEFSARHLNKGVSLFLAPALGMQLCCSSVWSGRVVCAALSIHMDSTVGVNYT